MENQTYQILYEINEKAAKNYCSLLLSHHGKAAISWLNGVGLSEESIKRFNLGYTGKERRGLVSYLNDLGYLDEQIIEAAKIYLQEIFKDNSDGHDEQHSLRVFHNAERNLWRRK